MKTLKIMFFAAMTALLFAACEKEEEPQTTVEEAAANTLVINDKTYHLNSHYRISLSGRTYADGETTELGDDGIALFLVRADVEEGSANCTVDLTQSSNTVEYAFGVRGLSFYFSQDDHSDTDVYGSIGEENYESSIFTSGTLTATKTSDLFTYKVTGTLKSGDKVSFHISVPASEWEHLDW